MNEVNLHEKHRERMYAKFMNNPDNFNDHELLEILLYSVIKRQDTNALAHKILLQFKDLKTVFEADLNTLLKIKGVGPKTAQFIKTIGLIYSRTHAETSLQKTRVKTNTPSAVKELVADFFENQTTEVFVLLLFDKNNYHINTITCGQGDTFKSTIDGSIITDSISVLKPSYAVIAHNHPSGSPVPSKTDDFATAKINLLLNMFSVRLADHIIITKNDSFSYFTSGRLQDIQNNYDLEKLIQNTVTED
ncbi:MAG: hypothetical protein J6V68_04510 [Clostridia bacterium]|nr:hypothetical protein [Clostridia bacterium]